MSRFAAWETLEVWVSSRIFSGFFFIKRAENFDTSFDPNIQSVWFAAVYRGVKEVVEGCKVVNT